jgi:hypothetical protein
VLGNFWRIFAQRFEGVYNKVDAIVAAVLVFASDQVFTH